MRRLVTSAAGVAALGLAALLYFHLGAGFTLELTDEGHLTYLSWRLAQGGLPHRDWHTLYPPPVFVLQGALLRWVGTDLAVLHAALAVAKVAIVLLVFWLARQVAGRAAALLAWIILVAIWGTPLWIFDTPYPNHYATLCTLAALAALLAGRGAARYAFAAGLCLGLASAFKQTTGVLAYWGVLWFLLYERAGRPFAGPHLGGAALTLARWGRAAAIAASALFGAGYLLRMPHAWTTTVLLTPLLATAALLARREWRRPPAAAQVADSLRQAIAATAGATVAPGLVALWYWRAGALPALASDTLIDLPQKFSWFTPFAMPSLFTWAVGLGLAALWAALSTARPRLRRAAWAAAALIGVGLFAAAAGAAPRAGSLWGSPIGTVSSLLAIVIIALIWATLPALFRSDAPSAAGADQRALSLVLFTAAWSLLLLQPAADLLHVFMISPIFAVLFAYHLDRLQRRGAAALLFAVALAAATAAPFALTLVRTRAGAAPDAVPLARASGINATAPGAADVAALVAFLADPARAAQPIFVVSNQPLLYFLADRRSPFELDDFTFYMVGLDIIPDAVAAASLDERQLVARLAQIRPLVIDHRRNRASARLARVFPLLGRTLADDYRPLAQFGPFEVRQWSAPAAAP